MPVTAEGISHYEDCPDAKLYSRQGKGKKPETVTQTPGLF